MMIANMAEECLKYIESLRYAGRSPKEVKEELRNTDFGYHAQKDALRMARKLKLVRVPPMFEIQCGIAQVTEEKLM